MNLASKSLLSQQEMEHAARLCSRLCHDLISPVGALANGIEILAEEDDADMRAQVIEMLADSARITSSKLKFFRFVFGASGADDENVNLQEVKATLDDYLSTGRAQLIWSWNASVPLPRWLARSVMVCAMMLSDALVRGGTINLEAGANGTVSLEATGERVILDKDTKTLLNQGPQALEWTSRNAPVIYLLALLQQNHRVFALRDGETAASMQIAAKPDAKVA